MPAWHDSSTYGSAEWHVEVLKFLAEDARADLDLKNIAGQTVCDTAIRHSEISASYLKSLGATQSGEVKRTKTPRNNI